MAETIIFPDAVAKIRAHLAPLITEPVVHAVPTNRPAAFVQLTRTGGVSHDRVIDAPFITVDCWATTSPAAMTLAQTVRAHLHAAEGTTIAGTGVYAVRELAGPADVPDPESDQPRVRQTFQIGLRAN